MLLLNLKVCRPEGFPVLNSLNQSHHVPGSGVAGEGIRLRVETGGRLVNRVNLLALLSGQTRGVVKAGETVRRWRKLTGMFTVMFTRMFTRMFTGMFTGMFTRMVSRMVSRMISRVIPRMVSGVFTGITGIPKMVPRMFSLLVNKMVAIKQR